MKKLYLLMAISFSLLITAISCTPEPIPEPTPATFTVTNLIVTPLKAQPEEIITITAEVTNTGDTSGSYLAILILDDEMQAQRDVYVAPNTKGYVRFRVKGGMGNYTVSVGGVVASYTIELSAERQAEARYYYEIYLRYTNAVDLYLEQANKYRDMAIATYQSDAEKWNWEMAQAHANWMGEVLIDEDMHEFSDDFADISERYMVKARHAQDKAREYYGLYLKTKQ